MGYKAYSGDRMGSPLTQKSKSKKIWEDEDRNLTLKEVQASKFNKIQKELDAAASELGARTDLSGNQKKAILGDLGDQAQARYDKGAQSSVDSMNRVRSADLAKFQKDWDYDTKSVDERDAMIEEMEKKGRWNLKKK